MSTVGQSCIIVLRDTSTSSVGSLHREDRSGWAFSVRIKGKVGAEQSEAYRSITLSKRKEAAAITVALR